MSGIMAMVLGAVSSVAVAVDEFFNRVTLLLPGNGTNGAQNNTFLDSSTNNFTITRNGNTTQGTFSPFSQTGWSNFFDGTDDYIAVADNAVLRPGTSNFTLEAWIWRNAAGVAHTIYAKGGASTGIVFQVTSTNVLRFTHTTTNIDSTGTIAANAWTHVAVVREGTGTNQTKLYINGTQDGQGTVSTDFTQTEEVRIGTNRGGTEDYNGYISNLRFVKGTALYTGTFTPSTSPLTTTSQGATATEVELLTCQSNRFIDNSSNAFSLTLTGTPSIQAFSPFAPTSAYDAATVGGSAYFDASGDSLSGNNVLVTSTTADTLSVEGWVYPTSFANTIWLVGDMAPTSNTNNISVEIATTGAVSLYWWTGSVARRCTGTTNMRLNQWNWFAIVVNANAISVYVNSTTAGQSGTTTLTSRGNATQNFALGQNNTSATPNAYVGSLRWSTSARTISAIPTEPYTSDANTRLICNFTNAGITDATAKNVLETVGNAQISTTQSKFGAASISFDGTGDWLLFPHNVDQFLSTGNFTVEMWVYRNASGTYGLVGKGTGTTGWLVSLNSSNQVVFTFASSTITSTGTVSATTWTHIAVVREGTSTNQTKIYINGTNDGTGTVSTDFNQTNSMYVGADRTGGSAFNGYIDDLRITRIARYTANFTAPTTAFPLQ